MSEETSAVAKYPFSIPRGEELIIRGDVFIPQGDGVLPLIIFCHGFKGFKDWGCWPHVANALAESGFAVVTFNFSRNGVGEDLEHFTELEKFRSNTFSHELDDLDVVIRAAKSGEIPGANRFSMQFGLMGHSRGGFSAICGAVQHSDTIYGIVTLASISRVYKEDPLRESRWIDDGVIYVRNARTGQELPLGVELLYDMRAQRDTIETKAQSLIVPALVIHGDADEAVNVSSAFELTDWIKNSKLLLLPGATHVFGATHPFEGFSPDLQRVVDEVKRFFNETLALH